MNSYEIRSKVVAITTDGASNFKCAMKRHGNDYETFQQLMTTIDDYEEELFQIDLNDLQNMWCPVNEFINEDVMPTDVSDSGTNDNDEDDVDSYDSESADDDSNDEIFRTGRLPNDILKDVVNDIDKNSAAWLPSRIDCSAHGLNLIGRKDSFNALKNDNLYAARYISVFKKLNAIWRLSSTRKGREAFDFYLDGYKIQKPHRIRWNRIYDAVSIKYRYY